MQSKKLGVALSVGAVALAVVLFVVLRGGDSDPESEPATPTASEAAAGHDDQQQAKEGDKAGSKEGSGKPDEPEVPTIVVKGGEPVGGVAELEFTKGEEIRFAVESDVADHVHLHGYDVFKDVPAGGRVELAVPATIEGVFEAELEESAVPIAEVTVNP